MNRFYILFISILILGIIALHALAITLHFYWTIWWFDILMHFLGGFTIGLFFYSVKHRLMLLVSIVCAVAVTSLLWEVYEVSSGMTFVAARDYTSNTITDVATGVAGGLAAHVYIIYKRCLH